MSTGHAEVYVLLLPAMGILGEVMCAFARKTLDGYKMIIWSVITAGLLSFVVWAHHQFISGIDPRLAIAVRRRGQYARAGFPIVSVVRGNRVARVQALAYATALLPLTLGLACLLVFVVFEITLFGVQIAMLGNVLGEVGTWKTAVGNTLAAISM